MRAQGGSEGKKGGVSEFIHGKKTETEKGMINVNDFRGECMGGSRRKQ